MSVLPRLRFSRVAIAAVLIVQGARLLADAPRTGPEPFIGQLTSIEGVQGIISLRHPALVNGDLEKMMAGIPEMAAARPALYRLAALGYPEFSDFAAGSNLGVAVLTFSPAQAKAHTVTAIGFARIKQGGKIWRMLEAYHLVIHEHDGWALIAKDEADMAKLTSADAVIRYLERPQAEDLRAWVQNNPELVSALSRKLADHIQSQWKDYPADKKDAAAAYIKALTEQTGQVQSAGLSLTLGDTGVTLSYFLQAQPDSPLGTFLRYREGPPPAVAPFISSQALATIVIRQNSQAAADWIGSIFDSLIAVDYPPLSSRFRQAKAAYETFERSTDGSAVGTIDLGLPAPLAGPGLRAKFFMVVSGQVTEAAARDYFRQSQQFNEPLSRFLASARRNSQGIPGTAPLAMAGMVNHSSFTASAATVDGIAFDRMTMATSFNGRNVSESPEYFGDVGGNIVMADSVATLEARLPALLARQALPDGIAVRDRAGNLMHAQFNGATLVEYLAGVAKLDAKDPDIRTQLARFKAEYALAGPPTFDFNAGQAGAEMVVALPYKFITATVHLSAYMAGQHVNIMSALTQALTGVAPAPAIGPGRYPSAADWNMHLARGQRLRGEGRMAEALLAYEWCYRKGTLATFGFNHAKLTALLDDVAAMSGSYPPALQALRDWRAQAAEQLRARPRDFVTLTKLVELDTALKDPAVSLAFYDSLAADSPARAPLGRMLYFPFIEARRYADALKARPFTVCRDQLERFARNRHDYPGATGMASRQPALIAFGAAEAEALAAIGADLQSREIIRGVLAIDSSPATIALLKTHLARAGHADWQIQEPASNDQPTK